MKKLLFLSIIVLLVLPLLGLADEIRVPISEPKQNIFSSLFFSVFSDTLNGLTCDATADATKIFTSSADTMGVGVSCSDNAYVNLYQCTDSSCSNYISVGRKAKVNGIPPIYSGLGIGNQYIYYCYNCGQTTQVTTCYYCGGGFVQTTTSNVYAEYGGCEKYPYQEPPLYSSPPTCVGCSPNWKCAIASDCINGQQKLYCYDVNNCNSNLNKPSETQSCGVSNTCSYNNQQYTIGSVIDECSTLGRKTSITGRNFDGNCQITTTTCEAQIGCAREGEKTKFNFPCCEGLQRDFSGWFGIGDTCVRKEIPQTTQNITKCNPETLENCPKKQTIKADKLASATLGDKLASQCERSIECSNNNCITLKKLEEDGFITKADANSVSGELKGTLTGTGIGAVGGLALCVAGAGFLGFTSGGLLTFPILIGVCSGGGALTGGIAGYWSSKGIKAIQEGNKEAYGFCIEEEQKEFSFSKFVSSIGKGVNDAFGGKAKTHIEDTTMGYIVLLVIGVIILMIFTRR